MFLSALKLGFLTEEKIYTDRFVPIVKIEKAFY